jgi:hypothetical protein
LCAAGALEANSNAHINQANTAGVFMRRLSTIFVTATVVTATVAMLLGGTADAKTIVLTGVFSSEQAAAAPVPVGAVVPSGVFRGKLDTATGELSYKITYAGLSGPVLAAHFHGPAAPGVDAGVMVPIPGPYHSGLQGEVKVTAGEQATIEAGKTYVNLHTAKNPNGEARAQVNVD